MARNFLGQAPTQAAPLQTQASNAPPQQGEKARVIGPVLGYYSDLASGYIWPERARVDNLQYRVRIDPAGQITFQSPALQIVSNYNFVLRRIAGFAMNPAALGNASALIDFNLREQGRSFDCFKRNVSFASIISTSGAGNLSEFDGVYITVPGTQLEVTWQVDTTRWGALVGASREVGIQLIGDLVSCRTE